MQIPNRIGYLDIARGIGILLVVLGHGGTRDAYPMLFNLIYAFHMPLFFFLSGMVFKAETPFREFFTRRLHGLVKPFFFTIFVLYFISVFFGKLEIPVAISRLVKSFYANGYYLEWVPMWFLPTLFVVSLLAWAVARLPGWGVWFAVVIFLALGIWMIGWFVPVNLPVLGNLKGLPWGADLALVSCAYFLFGWQARLRLPENWLASPWLLAGSGMVYFSLALFFLSEPINLADRLYPFPLLGTLAALAGILFVLALAFLLERGPAWLTNGLKTLGAASLVILIFHNPVQYILGEKLAAMFGPAWANPLVTFPFAIGIPLLLYSVVIRPNPLLSWWYGVKG